MMKIDSLLSLRCASRPTDAALRFRYRQCSIEQAEFDSPCSACVPRLQEDPHRPAGTRDRWVPCIDRILSVHRVCVGEREQRSIASR